MAATLRWIRWALALSLVAVVVLTLAVLVSLGLAARSETGSARLLSWVSGLQVVQPSGSIWGDFHALRIEWRGANGSRVTLVEPRWTGLTVSSAPQTAWRLAIVMDRLEARRVDVQWVSKPSPVAKGPPTTLNLPVAIKIGALSVDHFQSNWTGAEALGSVRGSLALQQAGALSGTPEHRVTLSQLTWQGWHLSGEGRVQVQGSMAVQAHVQAASALDEGDVSVSGPLRRLAVQGQVQVKARDASTTTSSPQRGAQSLTVSGVLAPFDAWPVPSAQVRSRQFDAQRLVASWPSTALSGDIDIKPRDTLAGAPGTRMQAIGKDAPAITAASDLLVHADLRNDVSGLWDAGRVPVVRLQADLVLPGQASTHTLAGLGRDGIMSARLTLPALGGRESGVVGVEGRWSLDHWQDTALRATLQRVELQALHSGAPALSLEGPVQVQGQPDRSWLITGDLQGRDGARKALAVPVQAQWSARWQPGRTTLNSLVLNAGGAQAKASGRWLVADGGAWQIEGDLALKGFDPAMWFPWPRPSGDALQGTRLDGQTQWKLAVATPGQWQGIQGQGKGVLSDSRLLGVPVSGQWQWQWAQVLQGQVQLKAAGNDAQVSLSMPAPRTGSSWTDWVGAEAQAKVQAPMLAVLQPWAQVAGIHGLTGQMSLDGRMSIPRQGQWGSSGQAQADSVSAELPGGGRLVVQGTRAQWSMSAPSAAGVSLPWKLDADVARAQWGSWTLQQGLVSLQGSPSQHHLTAQARIDLPERKLPSGGMFKESVRAQWVADGAWLASAGQGPRWTAHVQTLKVAPLSVAPMPAWLDVQPFEARWLQGEQGTQWQVSPTKASLFGTTLSIQQAQWQGQGSGVGLVDVKVALEPLKLSELLARWQPRAGWGGDLTFAGQFNASHRAGQGWVVDAQVARKDGDLSLAEAAVDGGGEQRFGVKQISLDLKARGGVWTARQTVEGRVLGSLQAQQVVQAHDVDAWPSAGDALHGDVTIQMTNLRPLGAWAPAGWRLAGQLTALAKVSGTLGAPQYRGTITGQKLGASHALLGVNLSEGDLLMTLQGDQARLDRLVARGGGENGGRVQLSGDALLGAQPTATLVLKADHFGLLNRIDRQAVVSGDAQLVLGAETIKVDGRVKVDEGLVDLRHEDAPTVGDDVNVVNRPGDEPDPDIVVTPTARRKWQVQLALDLGSALRLKGRGIDTHLSGTLRLSTPGGRPQVQGTVSTADGTYVAYGQKLVIERGSIAFTGPIDNPRLDIQAMRAQSRAASSSDVRVGVLISGTAQDPRVRLYSEPAMSETEKLSWLVLGRGPAGLGGADIGLLQTAASALLGGEGASPKDTVIGAIGLDELSVRQTDGAVRDTIVSLGKQVSNRWYVGYERSLNATTGTWQAIYRLAQRFTLRAQTGDDNAIDLIWSWRWGL